SPGCDCAQYDLALRHSQITPVVELDLRGKLVLRRVQPPQELVVGQEPRGEARPCLRRPPILGVELPQPILDDQPLAPAMRDFVQAIVRDARYRNGIGEREGQPRNMPPEAPRTKVLARWKPDHGSRHQPPPSACSNAAESA